MSNDQSAGWELTTRLVHDGERVPPPTGIPTTTPIYTTVTYGYEEASAFDAAFTEDGSYIYNRHGNPTVAAFERVVATAEAGRGAVAFGSGMAALHAALLACGTPRGSTHPQLRHIVASRDLYGETVTLLETFFVAQGVKVTYCDMADLTMVESVLADVQPDAVLVEQISNPLLRLVDVAAIAELAHSNGGRLIVDSTLATPILQRALTLQADVVVHSATKYLGGHCAATAGVAVARTSLLYNTLQRYAKLLGPVLGPFEAYQILLGIKTLDLRVRRQCANAEHIAAWLAAQPTIAQVYYPGLGSHPQHELAVRSFNGLFGAVVSFDLATATQTHAMRFLDALQLILPVTSLGDVYTLATAPMLSSHRTLTPAQRAERGIGDGLIRLSVGIEAVDDIIRDLVGALQSIT